MKFDCRFIVNEKFDCRSGSTISILCDLTLLIFLLSRVHLNKCSLYGRFYGSQTQTNECWTILLSSTFGAPVSLATSTFISHQQSDLDFCYDYRLEIHKILVTIHDTLTDASKFFAIFPENISVSFFMFFLELAGWGVNKYFTTGKAYGWELVL